MKGQVIVVPLKGENEGVPNSSPPKPLPSSATIRWTPPAPPPIHQPPPPPPPPPPPVASLARCSRSVGTHQLSVSGLIVFNLFLCFCQVLQLAFSNLTPFAISCLCLVIDRHDAQTSSSDQSWER